MKSKLNTILQLAIIVLLAVVIALQIFNINNKDADSDFVEKNLSQQKQWMDHIKEVGKKNITVTNDKISRGDYSTYIIGPKYIVKSPAVIRPSSTILIRRK